MKKVVIKTEIAETPLSKVSIKKYYGVAWLERDKGFVTQKDYASNSFKVLCIEKITAGNEWDSYNKYETLQLLIKALINGKFEVYEFNTSKELFKWLSE